MLAADRIYFAIQTVVGGLAVAAAALVANACGNRDVAEADRAIKLSIAAALAFSIALIVSMRFAGDASLQVFSLPTATRAEAVAYLNVLLYFCPVFAYLAIISASVRAAGDAVTPLWIGVVGKVINVILAIGLVYGRFGLPELGVMGAAYATGLAYAATCVIFHALWVAGRLVVTPVRQTF